MSTTVTAPDLALRLDRVGGAWTWRCKALDMEASKPTPDEAARALHAAALDVLTPLEVAAKAGYVTAQGHRRIALLHGLLDGLAASVTPAE